MSYFQALNYTLANEDTSVELAVLDEERDHVVTVAGSGGRALPLAARRPARITCVDLVPEQLWLTELRFSAARALEHAEFLAFLGYPPAPASPEARRAMFARLALSADARAWFEERFATSGWAPILYEGRWERTFAKLSRVNRQLTGARGLGVFDARTAEEHRAYMARAFPRARFGVVLAVLGNRQVFNALLYRGHFPKKNIPGSFYRFYADAYDKLFALGPARENFFLQLTFFGELRHAEGLPVECDPDVFARAKAALTTTEVRYVRGDVVDVVAASRDRPAHFVSLSDVPSYWSGARERDFLQELRPGLAPDARVMVRSYLRVPEGVDARGFASEGPAFADVFAREKVGMYRFDLYRRDRAA